MSIDPMGYEKTTEEVIDSFCNDQEVSESVEHWLMRRLQGGNPVAINEELIDRLTWLLCFHESHTPKAEEDGLFLRKEEREMDLCS